MIVVKIEYTVTDKAGRSFKPVNEIAQDVEHEFWDSLLFSEASSYQITVNDGTNSASIEFEPCE